MKKKQRPIPVYVQLQIDAFRKLRRVNHRYYYNIERNVPTIPFLVMKSKRSNIIGNRTYE